ncbi:MAG: hypothetical protein A2Z29_00270 [Chloroflexi bacterium RBG_16_56_11]|nr:MAG: hypothetical protein A2Z29_00270 [Chloroflexi bacterium RBG_16_56_11]
MQSVEIKVRGQIDRGWSDWFDGFNIMHNPEGESILVGSVRDQAELRGILSKLADLGLELVSLDTSPRVANP